MRKYFRWAVSALALLFLAVAGTLFQQNIEVWAERQGYHSLLADGSLVVSELELGWWFAFGFCFLAGVSLTLWADHWVRRISQKNTQTKRASVALEWGEHLRSPPKEVVSISNVQGWYYEAGSALRITLFFRHPIIDAIIEVAATKQNLKWKELTANDMGAIIEITGGHAGQRIFCNLYPAEWYPHQRRQAQDVEYDAIFIKDENEWHHLLKGTE